MLKIFSIFIPIYLILFLNNLFANQDNISHDEYFGTNQLILNHNQIHLEDYTLTIKDVLDLIKDNNINSIEDLIKILPAWYRSGYILVHNSQSIQGATHLHPRVILVGKNQGDRRLEAAGVVLTFNGDSLLQGYNTVEMVEFDEISKKFEFRIIKFDNNQVDISDPNPPLCLSCHGRGTNESYPIWDPYFRWPGIYGSMDGHIYKGSYEDRKFREFLSLYKNHPRYKYLTGLDKIRFDESKYEYYLRVNNIQLSEQAFKHPNGYFVEPYMGSGASGLNQVLDVANAKRIVNQIVSSRNFEKYKNLIYCAVMDTTAVDAIFDVIQPKISELISQRHEFMINQKEQLLAFSGWPLTEGRQGGSLTFLHKHIDRLYIISKIALGVDPKKWSLNISSGYSNFSRPTTNSLSYDVKSIISRRPDFVGVTNALNFIAECKSQLNSILSE